MTAPVTGITPIYGIEYLTEGEPAGYTRQKLQRNAEKIEAALVARGVPPADLQALIAAGWFSDTGWLDITPAAGFAAMAGAEKPQVRKLGRILLFQGGFTNAGMAVNGTYAVSLALPTSTRPTQTAIVGLGSSAGAAVASGFLTSAGIISVRTSATLGTYYKLDAFSGVLAA